MICFACGKCLTTEGVQRTIDGATVRLHATCAKKFDGINADTAKAYLLTTLEPGEEFVSAHFDKDRSCIVITTAKVTSDAVSISVGTAGDPVPEGAIVVTQPLSWKKP